MNIQNAILKEIIQSPEYFSKVRNILLENKVFETNNQVIFNIINKFYTDYAKIPNLTEIALQVKEIPNKEQRASIAESLKEIKNSEQINQEFLIDKTLEFVKDQVFTEAMMVGADFIDSKKENLKAKSRELMEKASKISLDFDLGLDYQDIDKRIDYYQNPKSGINYHRFNELAKRLGSGFQKGTLNLFLAPAGVGKSLLISSSITDFIQQGYNVLLVSMEMSDFEFVKRIDADNLDLPINDLKNIPKEIIKNKFKEHSNKLGKFYTKQYPAGSFSASMLESLLDMYKSNGVEFDLIFLDYIGIMKSDRVQPSVGLYSYIKAIAEEVRAVAVKRDLSIVSASQLNRCFYTNTIIKTKKGLKKAKDITLNDEVEGFDNTFNKVIGITPITKQKGYKIKLKSGKEIIVSENHKIPTSEGLMTINCGLSKGVKLNAKNRIIHNVEKGILE